MKPRRCLTPEEFATERKVSLRTVYRLIHARQIPAEKVGRQWRIWLVVQDTTPTPLNGTTGQDTVAKR